MPQSARQYDINGWPEIQGNPLSRVGVFEYLGSSINAPEPDRIYRVYRPEKELSDPECIESFKLLPWVIDHTMLGDGEMPAEQKGIHGVIGENVYYDDKKKMLVGNIKVFSDHHENLIDSGKKELSLGYRCKYLFNLNGTYNGDHYDAIQTEIRGNHLASVDEGRMGSSVAVLDSQTVTFDSGDFVTMDPKKSERNKQKAPVKTGDMEMKKENVDDMENSDDMEGENGEYSLSELSAMMKQLMPMLKEIEQIKTMMNGGNEENGEGMEEGEEMDEYEGKDQEEETEDEEHEGQGMDSGQLLKTIKSLQKEIRSLKKVPAPTLDSREIFKSISDRDSLASRLSVFTGSFDHREMTAQDVANYGIKKLHIPAEQGSEISAVEAWLHDRNPPHVISHRYKGQDAQSKNPVRELFRKSA